jgi:hypothetical protein
MQELYHNFHWAYACLYGLRKEGFRGKNGERKPVGYARTFLQTCGETALSQTITFVRRLALDRVPLTKEDTWTVGRRRVTTFILRLIQR